MPDRIFTQEMVRKAVELRRNGFSYRTICQHMNVNGSYLSLADACRRYEAREKKRKEATKNNLKKI